MSFSHDKLILEKYGVDLQSIPNSISADDIVEMLMGEGILSERPSLSFLLEMNEFRAEVISDNNDLFPGYEVIFPHHRRTCAGDICVHTFGDEYPGYPNPEHLVWRKKWGKKDRWESVSPSTECSLQVFEVLQAANLTLPHQHLTVTSGQKVGITARGAVTVPSASFSGTTASMAHVMERKKDLVVVENYSISTQGGGTSCQRFTFTIHEGEILCSKEHINPPEWMGQAKCPRDLFPNPCNKEHWHYLPEEWAPVYVGEVVFVDFRNCIYLYMENMWVQVDPHFCLDELAKGDTKWGDELNLYFSLPDTID